jgi:hypothetical protein
MKMIKRKKIHQHILLNPMNHLNIIEWYKKNLFSIEYIPSFQISSQPVFTVNRIQ